MEYDLKVLKYDKSRLNRLIEDYVRLLKYCNHLLGIHGNLRVSLPGGYKLAKLSRNQIEESLRYVCISQGQSVDERLEARKHEGYDDGDL